MSKQELLIGCGSDHTKRLTPDGVETWTNLTTLDYNGAHKPDIEWDLMDMPLPFPDNFFDEVHAYEVLEHTGAQGDYKFFFRQFEEFYRILKAGGHLLVTCPSKDSRWAWGDPSHTRILQPEQLIFLSQPKYEQVGKTSMSDFRNIYKADFDIVWVHDDREVFQFILKTVKPSRIFGATNEPTDDLN
jgi:predicted SAM-dependent methyltransferase